LLVALAAVLLLAIPGTAQPAGGIATNIRPTIAFVRNVPSGVPGSIYNKPEIFTIDAFDHVARLTDSPAHGFSTEPAWSPDGARIAFSRYDPATDTGAAIFVMDADGLGLTRLTDGSGGDGGPAWSPDGRKIAFASKRDGDFAIFVLDLASGTLTKLTDSTFRNTDPSWSPDGTKIAFVSRTVTPTSRENDDIFTINVDGTGLTNLTNTPDCYEARPAWKPDGLRIAYEGCEAGVSELRDGIYTMLANGGATTKLYSDAGFPAWSSDGLFLAYTKASCVNGLCTMVCVNGLCSVTGDGGQPDWQPRNPNPTVATNGKIVFASDRDGDLEIYSMNGDGTGQTRLTNSPGDDSYPVWSPNGAQIAFASMRNGSSNIFRMGAGGGVATPVTSGPAFDIQPTWSPDGSRIAFVSDRTGSLQIFSVTPNGTELLQLTATGGFNVDAAWSPDGMSIVFTSSRDGNEEIYVMAADGTNPRRLTNDPGRDYGPYWSPDGSKIVFQSERDGNSEIYVMRADGSAQTRVTTDPGIDSSPAWSPDGKKIVFHSNRDGNFEIYSMNVNGTDQTRLTSNAALDKFPDWQRVVTNGDVDPPVLTLPANITVDATSLGGAAVAYSVTSTDAVDPLPVVSCSPPSGSTFAVGTTTVACTATDNSANSSSGSFTVTVVGANDQLVRLMQSVVASSRLPQAVRNLLLNAAANFNPNNAAQRRAVCNALAAFIPFVQRLAATHAISAAQASEWIADANRIRAVLGC